MHNNSHCLKDKMCHLLGYFQVMKLKIFTDLEIQFAWLLHKFKLNQFLPITPITFRNQITVYQSQFFKTDIGIDLVKNKIIWISWRTGTRKSSTLPSVLISQSRHMEIVWLAQQCNHPLWSGGSWLQGCHSPPWNQQSGMVVITPAIYK